MRGFQTREVRIAMREALMLAVAAAGAILFVRHDVLYLGGSDRNVAAPLASYLIATAVLYLAIRLVVIAIEMRTPRAHAELVRCPECGQWLDDPTAGGLEAHNRMELTPKPTEKEIVSAVALRKAVDAARRTARPPSAVARENLTSPPGPIENLSGKDLLAAIDDPDLLERLLHSPNPPRDPRIKR